MSKKTVLIHSNFSRLLTGFGRTSRTLLRYLYKTGKYNLVEAANGLSFDDPNCKKLPWICHGTSPTPEHEQFINQDPGKREFWSRAAGYGYFGIDKIVDQYKPDAVFSIEDYWGFFGFDQKQWFNKTNPILWTTADSTPFQNDFVEMAKKYKNIYCWASFAEKEFLKKGMSHVKTLHGCIDPKPFFNIGREKRLELRSKFGINPNSFIFGTVSRNQLRKGFPYILDGLVEFKKANPSVDAKVFIHTSFQEGFDLPFLAKEKGIDPSDLLATYYCPSCKQYEVKPFCGHDQKCRYCGFDKANTVSIVSGLDDEQLNEIYNLFDCIIHPANSGGLEYVVLEGKLCEIPVCTTSYSYGEDAVGPYTGGFGLDWEPYTEIGSNFTKAAVKVSSILENLNFLFKEGVDGREAIGQVGRKYVLENYSIDVIGPKIEKIIEELPAADWNKEVKQPNPNHQPLPNLSPEQFISDLFLNVLGAEITKDNAEFKFWLDHLVKSKDYQGVYNYFVNQARQKLPQKQFDLSDLLDKDDEGKRIAMVCPQSGGDILIINSLLGQFKSLYPEFNLYFFTLPQFRDLIENHPAIHKVLDYHPQFDDIFYMEGRGEHKGYFEAAFYPFTGSQKFFNYQHNKLPFRAEWLT